MPGARKFLDQSFESLLVVFVFQVPMFIEGIDGFGNNELIGQDERIQTVLKNDAKGRQPAQSTLFFPRCGDR